MNSPCARNTCHLFSSILVTVALNDAVIWYYMFVGIKKKQHIFMIIVIYTVEKCIFIFTNHFNSKIFTKICYALILVTILTV